MTEEPNPPPTGEEILEMARRRRPRPEPLSRVQIAVRNNIVDNVGYYFVADPGGAQQFILNPELHPDSRTIIDDPYEIVSWEYVGIHVRPFRGVSPTGKPVWFRGLTIALPSEESRTGLAFSQFIDWREVLLQLGVVPEATRPLLTGEDIARRDRLRPDR